MRFIQPVVRYILDGVCEGKGYIKAQARFNCVHPLNIWQNWSKTTNIPLYSHAIGGQQHNNVYTSICDISATMRRPKLFSGPVKMAE